MRTIEGVPPLSFKSDGKPLTAWSIYGNGQQTGKPAPDNQIQPEFVGTIPTANGENALTFDTAIQPIKVSITGSIKE